MHANPVSCNNCRVVSLSTNFVRHCSQLTSASGRRDQTLAIFLDILAVQEVLILILTARLTVIYTTSVKSSHISNELVAEVGKSAMVLRVGCFKVF